jgi:hypothetical protein
VEGLLTISHDLPATTEEPFGDLLTFRLAVRARVPDRGVMVTPASSSRQPEASPDDRAQPPIRWPHPDRESLGLVLLWAVGLFLALFVPALFVAPTATKPPAADVWKAFASTLVGALVMLGAAGILWRRKADASVLLMGAVPAFACVAGGIILTAAKLTGT